MKIVEEKINVPSKSGKKIYTVIQYVLSPEPDYVLRHKISGHIVRTFIVVPTRSEIAKYEEIED